MNLRPSLIDVSVVIPAYNQAALLERLLDSLCAMEKGPAWEVIVVDDASSDDTGDRVKDWLEAHDEVRGRYIRQEQNQGPGTARNRGLAVAKGTYVAFTDSDCVVTPGWLNALVTPLRENDRIVGTGGAVAPWNPDTLFARYNTVNRTLQPIQAPDYPIPYLVTCNCAYRREILLQAGGFPEDIPRPGGEDVAASIALYKQGHRFGFAPEALVYHEYRDTWRSFMRTWTNYGFGCGLIARRMLTPEERNPEWGKWDGENYWGVQAIRPTVTGFRSLYSDLRWHGQRCREESTIAGIQLPTMLLLRILDRLSYLRGWKAGMKHFTAWDGSDSHRE